MDSLAIGLFGVVIGFITYRALARSPSSAVSDISSVIAAISGAAVLTFLNVYAKGTFQPITPYCIGLFIGFFGYLFLALTLKKPIPFA